MLDVGSARALAELDIRLEALQSERPAERSRVLKGAYARQAEHMVSGFGPDAVRRHRAERRQTECAVGRRFDHVADRLFPHGLPQERAFNILYYWSLLGPDWMKAWRASWPSPGDDSLIWRLPVDG
jgi:hypothetical protein